MFSPPKGCIEMPQKPRLGLVFFPAFDWAISPDRPEREERLLYTKDLIVEQGLLDLDEIIEWTSHQWLKVWPTASCWRSTPRSPLHIPGLNGLYFVGSTVEVDGLYQDIEANSALQSAELILQHHSSK